MCTPLQTPILLPVMPLLLQLAPNPYRLTLNIHLRVLLPPPFPLSVCTHRPSGVTLPPPSRVCLLLGTVAADRAWWCGPSGRVATQQQLWTGARQGRKEGGNGQIGGERVETRASTKTCRTEGERLIQ